MYLNKDIEQILAKHFLGNITDQEEEILKKWISLSDENKALFQKLSSADKLSVKYKNYTEINSERAWGRFKKKHIRSSRIFVLRYAATLLLPIFIACGMWYFSLDNKKEEKREVAETVLPGISQATLTLPGNQKRVLTGCSTSPINVNKSTIAVPHNGTLIYSPIVPEKITNSENEPEEKQPEEIKAGNNENNTLTTEGGNEFWVKLEDGTVIHLNYNTELRYPVRFGNHERTVYLKGEAYFKIAKDARPFYVITDEGSIKQYGTEFNVNTFTPGRTEVVLVRGKISLSATSKNKETFLKPGQVANLQKNNGGIEVRDIDPATYVGWNYGRLIFNNTTLEDIMQTLKHWYGVNIYFEQESLKNLHFTGDMDRYGSINPILQAIAQTTNIRISIKEKKVIISSFN